MFYSLVFGRNLICLFGRNLITKNLTATEKRKLGVNASLIRQPGWQTSVAAKAGGCVIVWPCYYFYCLLIVLNVY